MHMVTSRYMDRGRDAAAPLKVVRPLPDRVYEWSLELSRNRKLGICGGILSQIPCLCRTQCGNNASAYALFLSPKLEAVRCALRSVASTEMI